MSGRGGVGSRERLRLAGYPAVPASLAGCRCQARGVGLFHLADAWSRPRQPIGALSWGGNPSPLALAPHDVSSMPAAASAGSPQGLALLEPPLPRAARRPLPLSPGVLLRPLLLLNKPDPPHEPGGRELVLGETPPPRLEEDFFSHTFSSQIHSRSHPIPIPLRPRFPTVSHAGGRHLKQKEVSHMGRDL